MEIIIFILVFAGIAIAVYIIDANKRKIKREELKLSLIREANDFVARVNEQKKLNPVSTSILLKKGEDAYLQTETILRETKAVRQYSSSGGGVGFRVAKGVYVGGGSSSGTSESHQEWRDVDAGRLVVTNKRLIFDGSKENRSIPLDKIISVEPWIDAIEVSIENRTKSMLFTVGNPFICATVIHVLVKSEDPQKIDGIKATFLT